MTSWASEHRAVGAVVAGRGRRPGAGQQQADHVDHEAERVALVPAERQECAAVVEVLRVGARGRRQRRPARRGRPGRPPRAGHGEPALADARWPSRARAAGAPSPAGAAQASGLGAQPTPRPPYGATVASAWQKAEATRPRRARPSTYSPSRPTWLHRRTATIAVPCSGGPLRSDVDGAAERRAGRSRSARRRRRWRRPRSPPSPSRRGRSGRCGRRRRRARVGGRRGNRARRGGRHERSGDRRREVGGRAEALEHPEGESVRGLRRVDANHLVHDTSMFRLMEQRFASRRG